MTLHYIKLNDYVIVSLSISVYKFLLGVSFYWLSLSFCNSLITPFCLFIFLFLSFLLVSKFFVFLFFEPAHIFISLYNCFCLSVIFFFLFKSVFLNLLEARAHLIEIQEKSSNSDFSVLTYKSGKKLVLNSAFYLYKQFNNVVKAIAGSFYKITDIKEC